MASSGRATSMSSFLWRMSMAYVPGIGDPYKSVFSIELRWLAALFYGSSLALGVAAGP